MPGPDIARRREADFSNVPDYVINYISAETARAKQVVPFVLDGTILRVGALADDLVLEDELSRTISERFEGVRSARLVVVAPEKLNEALDRYYPANTGSSPDVDLNTTLAGEIAKVAAQRPADTAGERVGL